jgi:hypothetical protein
MATSGTYDFTTNRDSLIKGALRLVGGLGQGETPTAAQYTEAAEALNMYVKAMANKGVPLWAIKKVEVTLVEGQAEYEIGPGKATNTTKPLKLYTINRNDNANDTSINLLEVSQREYFNLTNKEVKGVPNQVYFEPLLNYSKLYVYPTPDAYTAANNTVEITYQSHIQDFDVSTDEPDFPQEFFEALKYGLAVRLSGEYGMERFDRTHLKQEYKEILDDALGFNAEEASMFFQPERRNW